MSNRAPITTEDTAGAPTPLEPGSVVAGPTPGYYQISAGGISGTSVPAVPATIPIRDAAAGFEVAYLDVDTTPAVAQTGAIGRMIWNDTAGTIEFQLKGGVVNLQIGQEQVLRVRNLEVTPLTDGQVVYIAGSSGTHNDVRLADASLESTSSLTIGVVTEPIAAHPGEGFINTFGLVTCDTNHLIEGAAVWLSTVTGATTATRPTAPDHAVLIGFCVKKAGAGAGRLFVSVNNGYELSELHDVLIGAQAEGDILAWDNTTKVWRNKVPSTQPWVLKAGDTMTGALTISNNLSVSGGITAQTQLDFDTVADPVSVPVATVLPSTGNVNIGTHYYFVAFITAIGETALYTGAFASATTSAGNQQVLLTGIPTSPDPRVTGRRIYRTGAGQPYYADVRILATLADNVTTTYTDNLADASRTGAANYYLRENTTCRYLLKDGAGASFFGKNFTVFGAGAAANLFLGTASGGGNTCIGYEAGKSLTSGDQNIIISNSATGISTGTSNVLISGNWGNNPSNSVLIGRNAGAQNSGSGNVGIGFTAAPTGHNYCVSLGSYANNNVTGNGCTAIGYYAGYAGSTAAGAYNVNIGCAVASPNGAASGQLNIGNVLYGTGLYQSTSVSSTPTATGSLGVCVASPTARLQLPAGAASASSAPLKFTSGPLTTAAEAGAVEFDGSKYYATAGADRKELLRGSIYTPTLTPAAIVSAGYWTQTFTVTGLTTSDTVTVNGPAAAANTVLVHARVSAADTLALTWITSSAATPATGVYRVLAVRS